MSYEDVTAFEDAIDLMIDSDIDINTWADTWSQLEAEEAFISNAENKAIMDLNKLKAN